MESSDNQSTHAVRKTLIAKLVKGREVAMQLQTLIDKPVRDRGAVVVEDLALQIFRSFDDSLSVISSCADSTRSAPISACSDDRSKKSAVKNRRGCYKRRKTSDTWMTISGVEVDEYMWRKYGQKHILNFEFPRCYYKCTHKQQGCKAMKQVQKIKEDPILYQTTYLNHHTCTHTPLPLTDRHQLVPNLLSFQSTKIPHDQSTNPAMIPTVDHAATPPSVKEEDDHHEDVSSSDAKSSLLQYAKREIFSYDHNWEEEASCGSTSFDWLGMEINDQFPDIETFHLDHIYGW